MKHRSPLITLAAVALAFAIMFIVNMTVSPPGSGSTGIPGPPAAPATATAGSPSPIETAAASPSPEGTLQIKSEKLKFEINETEKPAGLYRARGSKTTIGWIVLEDGSQMGVQTTGADSTDSPELNPGNPQVTVEGENLNAAPVNGDEDL